MVSALIGLHITKGLVAIWIKHNLALKGEQL